MEKSGLRRVVDYRYIWQESDDISQIKLDSKSLNYMNWLMFPAIRIRGDVVRLRNLKLLEVLDRCFKNHEDTNMIEKIIRLSCV